MGRTFDHMDQFMRDGSPFTGAHIHQSCFKADFNAYTAQTDYKKQKEQILKTNFDDETNWNYLFMN